MPGMHINELNYDNITKSFKNVDEPGHEQYQLPQGSDWGESVPHQDNNSAGTSRNMIATPFKHRNIPWQPGEINLDIGGGKYDVATEHMKQRRITNLVFDPYNRDPKHNNRVLDYIDKRGGADTVTVNNVLNVLKGKDLILSVIHQAAEAVKPEGTVFFKIYTGNMKCTPGYTRDGFQQHKDAKYYIPLISQYFSKIKIGQDIIVAAGPKNIDQNHANFYPDKDGEPRQLNLVRINESTIRNYIRQCLNEAADQILDQQYLQAVMSGDMEKARQMVCNAFHTTYPNTTIVDNNGDPRILYHGDKSKKRYIFSSNTFFGETEEYAGRYTQGTGEVAKFYLNIQHPFDIRDNKARAIFTEYRNDNEPTQTKSGAMDWADFEYDDLQEYLEDNYPGDYDGIIMDEGADGGYGAPVVRRGLSYVPFYPNQIKSAEPVTYDDNNQIIPLSQRFTNNNDVRYEEE